MDHSEEDKRFCVYVLKDKQGNIVYVGHGNKYRPFIKRRNNKKLSEIINDLQPEILHENLSKNEAISIEIELFDKYKNSGYLLNKHRPSKINPIQYDIISEYLCYDETSPTFLRWKTSIFTGENKSRLLVEEGKAAGTIKRKEGYVETKFNNKSYKNHRLIWSLCNKCDLDTNLVIDHIDGNKSNNNIANLRLVSQKENMSNIKLQDIEKELLRNVIVYEDRCIITVRWMEGFIRKSKTFNYKTMFPGLGLDVAKEKCLEVALWYKQQINQLVKE